jgi:hypothetical protein
MVKCLICGVEKPSSIVEHIKYDHKMKSADYRKLYPGANVKSEELLLKFKNNMKALWDNPEYREKQTKIRNITHKDPEYKKRMSEKIKKIHKETPEVFSGFTNWHKTDEFKEWVVSEERKDKIRKTSKERWENDDFRNKTIESIKKTLNDGRCKKSVEFRENMSKKISELYSLGIIKNEKNKYKTGVYTSKKNEDFIYSSSYELDSMKLFDETEHIEKWTNKHGIRIRYYFNDLNRHYVPDFLVDFKNGKSYIIEMKGWYTEEVDVKKHYTLKIYPNYKIFYNVEELKNFINENK